MQAGKLVGGRYRIVRLIARGGMGLVYEAVHVITGHRVALKLLYTHYADNPTTAQRFMNEARASATLRHPHIARCEDAGVSDEGLPFLVLELLEGHDLARELQLHGRLDLERALAVVRQISAALSVAHAAGIVHRDLKPENIFLSHTGSGDLHVKLLDFGIARFAVQPHGHGTRTGAAMGTPLYMAPEQFRDASRVDQRADVYALGVVFYEMLTGRVPFEADSMPELIARISTGEFTPLLTLRGDIPQRVAGTIEHALEPDLEARPPSVEAFLAELDGHAPLPRRGVRARWRLLLAAALLACGALGAHRLWAAETTSHEPTRSGAAAPAALGRSAAPPAPPPFARTAPDAAAPAPTDEVQTPPEAAPSAPRSAAKRPRRVGPAAQPKELRRTSILDEPDF